jgi:hypothetical protein
MTLQSLYEVAKAQKNVLDIMTGQSGAYRMTTVKLAASPPGNPQQYDIWLDTTASNKIRVYDGSNWLAVSV